MKALPVQLGYDAHGRLETVTQGPRTLARIYGQGGFLASIVDPLGQARVFDVDAGGRVLAETTWTYDLDRKPALVTKPGGVQVSYGYDAAGRPASITFPGGRSRGAPGQFARGRVSRAATDGRSRARRQVGPVAVPPEWASAGGPAPAFRLGPVRPMNGTASTDAP